MTIVSPNSPQGKICRLCKEEKYFTYFGGPGGVCISPICIECEQSLPPVPSGQKRCYGCFACVSQQEYKTNKSRCKECQKKRRKASYDAEKIRDINLRANYGISLEDYNIMLFQQSYVCAVCKQEETVIDPYTKQIKALAVDHNHETGKVRQLLCTRCNYLLGFLEIEPKRIKALMKYLKKHQE